MPILYSAVAKERTVVGSFRSCEGNFTEIVTKILEQIYLCDEKKTYHHGRYLFHYIVKNKIVYLCITDKTCQRSRAFLFLNEIRRKYQAVTSVDLRNLLAKDMHRYSEDYSDITIRKGELDELNSISVESSENILGEKILKVIYNPDEALQQPRSFYINNTCQQVTVPELSEKPRSQKFTFVIIFILVLICMYCFLPTVIIPVFVILLISFLVRKKQLK